MAHKTQEVAMDILKMFDKQNLKGEEAVMVVALIFRQVGATLNVKDPKHLMKMLHAALLRLTEAAKDPKVQDVIYKLH